MSETKLHYELHAGTIGATIYLDAIEQVSADPRELQALQSTLDARGVVCIRTQRPPSPEQLGAFERFFGVSASRGRSQMLVSGSDFLDDYSTPPKFDDGRPRAVAPTDFIHVDTMSNGPAAFGVHATLSGTSLVPMRFADMRAVYASLPDTLKRTLLGWQARHSVPRGVDGAAPVWTLQPLAALHPRSGAALLLLPNRGACRVDGMPDDQATALVGELWRATEDAPEPLEISLRPNTLIIWDNILCTHTNPGFPRGPGRVVWFFNIMNERPIQPASHQGWGAGARNSALNT
jgi:alpha-ketoglutarate-dependent taurine dioxygenase